MVKAAIADWRVHHLEPASASVVFSGLVAGQSAAAFAAAALAASVVVLGGAGELEPVADEGLEARGAGGDDADVLLEEAEGLGPVVAVGREVSRIEVSWGEIGTE